jgi:hypothetical protein
MITKGFLQFYSNISGEKCIRLFEMPSLQFVHDTSPSAFVEKKAANRLSKMYLDIEYCVILCTIMRTCVCVFGATEFCGYPCSNWFTEFLHEGIVT